MTAAIITFAWIGALAWPLLLALAAWRTGWLLRLWGVRALAAGVTAAWALGVWAFLIEPELLVVKEVEVASPAWRGPPLRIGVIGDVHMGVHMSPGRIRRVVARMNALEPDVIVLAGDYVSRHAGQAVRPEAEQRMIANGLGALGGLDAPFGVYAVLGNHDWWYDGPQVESRLAAAGVRVLENAAAPATRGGEVGGELWLVGLADDSSKRTEPDWHTTLAYVPRSAGVVALAHRPDAFADAPARPALTIAAHSHCGQVHPPFLTRPAISPGSQRWPCGLYEVQGRHLFVTGGLGVSMLPARFRAPPEIAVVTLKAAPGGLERPILAR